MIRLVLARLVGAAAVLLIVATLAFFALKAAPGGPFDSERRLSPEVARNVERAYHLDWPLWKQYVHYVDGLVRGDLGPSMRRPMRVTEIIAEGFPRSLALGLTALALAVAVGLALGVLAAARRDTWVDRAAMTTALVGVSMPAFVLGPLLILWVSLRLGWLPAARWEGVQSLVLPAATLGLIYIGAIARLTRAGLVETMAQDYIRTARAKGLPERVVVGKHALRLAILPVLTYLGPVAASLITGSIVVESIFELPGLGFSFVASVQDRDAPVLTGLTVFYCLFLLLMNLMVDIATVLLDPRTRDNP